MSPNRETTNEWFIVFVWSMLGLIGGAVRFLEDGCERKFSFRRMVASLVTSAFVGALVGAAAHSYFNDYMLLGAACAMAGYGGQITLLIIIQAVKKKVL